jgi:hypothetical protein
VLPPLLLFWGRVALSGRVVKSIVIDERRLNLVARLELGPKGCWPVHP